MDKDHCVVGRRVKTKGSVKDHPAKVGIIEKVGRQLGYDIVFVKFDKVGREYGFAPEELCAAAGMPGH